MCNGPIHVQLLDSQSNLDPCHYQGIARTQSPTNKNYAFELPTFGVIVGVNPTVVQWPGLTLEEPPSWSWLTSTPGKYALVTEQDKIWTLQNLFKSAFKTL